jgi:hypothetical protein
MEDWNALAGLLLAALGDHTAERGAPTWVEVVDPPGGVGDVQLFFSENQAGFFGWVAPPDCQAVGLVATGRVWATEPDTGPTRQPDPGAPPHPHSPAGAPPEPGPAAGAPPEPVPGVRLACVVARDGTVGWRMTLPDGTVQHEAPQEGRLVDCLRRCFGLPTAPPPAGAGMLQSVIWVLSVLDAASLSTRPLTWRQVACLHPLARACSSSASGLTPPAGRYGRVLTGMAGPTWTWDVLRRHAGLWAGELVTPEIAEWMDDGMFSRWVLTELPDPEQLIRRVRPLVTPSAARRLAHAVRSETAEGSKELERGGGQQLPP